MKPEDIDINFDKSNAFFSVEIIEYVPNSEVSKTVIKKLTGKNMNAEAFETGERLSEKSSPFDTFTQMIDGKAEIVINGESNVLETGQSIIIPAHTTNFVKANERFKMISTVVMSGSDCVLK